MNDKDNKPMSDEQVKKIMNEDPAAMLFLEGMLPGVNNTSTSVDETNFNDISVADPNATLNGD